MKEQLAADDPSNYASGKTEFVYDTLQRAGWRYGQMYTAPGQSSAAPVDPVDVEGREDLSLFVAFEDGVSGTFDMSGLVGRDAFPQLTTAEAFERVRIVAGAIRWDAGPAVDPAYLYRLFMRTAR